MYRPRGESCGRHAGGQCSGCDVFDKEERVVEEVNWESNNVPGA